MTAGAFEFPPLGATGDGPVRGEQGRLVWQSQSLPGFYVTEQRDHPAVAYRCHYDHDSGFGYSGSSPCDHATMVRFIEFVTALEKENEVS